MEAHSHFGKLGAGRAGRTGNAGGARRAGRPKRARSAIASRRTSLLVALVSATLAAVLIYMFVSHYHRTTVVAPTTATVFVARRYIPAGTPETSVASGGMLRPKVEPLTQVVAGAISDPSQIAGQVVSAPIAAGQQATVSDFTHANVTISSYLAGAERAVAISIDPAHGLTSYLSRGNTVDVMAQGQNGSFVLFENVTVLGNEAGHVVLELTDRQTLSLANDLAHNFSIWLALRPVTDAKGGVHAGFNERWR